MICNVDAEQLFCICFLWKGHREEYMQKKLLCILLGMLGSTVAVADSYEVAHSKAGDLRILVDNATQENWCQPQVHFRFQGGASTPDDYIAKLFPKLGGALEQKCPSIETITWAYHDVNAQIKLTGTSSKTAGWPYQLTQSSSSEQATTPQEVATEATTPAETPMAKPTQDAATAPSATTPSTTAAVNEAPVSVTKSYIPLDDFKVGDWTPPSAQEREKLAQNLSIKKNQDGCKLLSQFDFNGQEDYIQIKTQELSCDANGFLDGTGVVTINRTDGATILNDTMVSFSHGLPVVDAYRNLSADSLVYVYDNGYGGKKYLFSAGSDKALNTHYLLETTIGFHRGLGVFQGDTGYVLVDNLEDFKQADKIKVRVDAALEQFDKVIGTEVSRFSLMFIDNLAKGVAGGYGTEGKVYKATFGKRTKWSGNRTVPTGPWIVESYSVKNYVFEREREAAAERARQEAEKQRQERMAKRERAMQEQQRLQQYESLKGLDLTTPDKIQSYVYENVTYDSLAYSQLFAGAQKDFSSIVHVDSADKDGAIVDWPYEIHVSGASPLKEGWYWIRGKQVLDSSKEDKDGLPMTNVSVSAEGVYACQQEKCADLQDPLVLMKILHGVTDWTPEQARQIINEAE